MSYHRPHLRLRSLKRAIHNEDRLTYAQLQDRMTRGIPAHIKPGPRPVMHYPLTATTGSISYKIMDQ